MLVTMSDKELSRINVIQAISEKRLRQRDAVSLLNLTERQVCKYTRFSSTHFLRFRYFQLITSILPVSDHSGIHVVALGYIPSASVP